MAGPLGVSINPVCWIITTASAPRNSPAGRDHTRRTDVHFKGGRMAGGDHLRIEQKPSGRAIARPARTAKPSTPARSKAGTSVSATSSDASTRPSACVI